MGDEEAKEEGDDPKIEEVDEKEEKEKNKKNQKGKICISRIRNVKQIKTTLDEQTRRSTNRRVCSILQIINQRLGRPLGSKTLLCRRTIRVPIHAFLSQTCSI